MVKEIQLTQGKVALVDDEDYERVNQYKWCAHKRWTKQQQIQMHRFIMSAPDGMEVNHWDHNGLNNQRSNLIIATHKQNICYKKKRIRPASSQYKGVSWSKNMKKWKAYIRVDGKSIHLGYFDKEIEAALAYNQAASIHFGEFAYLNKMDG